MNPQQESSNIISTIFVNQKNKMYGKVDVVEKLKIDETLNPIEDSFTRRNIKHWIMVTKKI